VVIQNIGEYISGSKVDIHDSVVQRSSLGSKKEEETMPDLDPLSQYETEKFYESILQKAWEDGYVNESEFRMLKNIRRSERITLDDHREIEKKIVERKGLTPMRCPECGSIGEYVVEKKGYYCPKCESDI